MYSTFDRAIVSYCLTFEIKVIILTDDVISVNNYITILLWSKNIL